MEGLSCSTLLQFLGALGRVVNVMIGFKDKDKDKEKEQDDRGKDSSKDVVKFIVIQYSTR